MQHCVSCDEDGHTYLECQKLPFFSLAAYAFGVAPLGGPSREELAVEIQKLRERNKAALT